MKKTLLMFFIALILLSALTFYNNSNLKIILSNLTKKGDIQADTLRYRIYLFGVLPLGEAIFSNKGLREYRGQRVYHLAAQARPLEFFSNFFSRPISTF